MTQLGNTRKNLKRNTKICLTGLIFAALLTGCASTRLPTVPSFVSDGHQYPGKIIWHDLVTPDIQLARSFYSHLFGWSFEDVSAGYSLIKHHGQYIGGIAELNQTGNSAYWLPQMSVPDLNKAVAYTIANKGTIMLEPFVLPGRGRIAVVKDPQGAIFGMIEADQGDPEDQKAQLNEWLWNEVWTHDLAASEAFYIGLIGYQSKIDYSSAHPYHYLEYQNTPRIGLLNIKNEDINNTWATYIRVENVTDTVARAKGLRGQILLAPKPDIRNGTVAIITDPSGAGILIQEWTQ